MDQAAVRPQIATLVSKFAALSRQQKSAMNEQTIRLQFILPLFRLLGWDIEDPRDMSAEEHIARGFVDFGFYLNGVPAFYLETKRPGDSLDVLDYKRQAINYAYLKGVTWAVLTNFDEIRVFNAEWATDVHQAQFLTLRHDDYAERDFDDLWLLAKPAMHARELDRRAEKYGKKDKKKPVNKVLLEQLLDWRERLFRNIRLYPENQQLWATPHEIDNAIQKLFDRLIFLRSVEDRGIDGHLLKELLRGSKRADLFASLLKLFRDMNGVYNSNLFEDHTLDGLAIHDGELVYNLLDGLYYGAAEGKRFEYNFAAISADILGAVYEQYLGYKVQDPDPEAGGGRLLPDSAPAKRSKAAERTRAGDRAKKRKMQGIYYTPQYIVRYIVAGTVGRLLESGADPLTLRVVDPACGSGSFLIEAFDVLDRWLEKHKPELPEHERRRHILTHNLYGVDLDDQAVEVTRLNLTLRASLKREKLPMLHHIRCADSLRADWGDLFPDVIAAGGFDAVIGNPPYGATLTIDEQQYFKKNYKSARIGNIDTYALFIEQAIAILRSNGYLSFITPDTFLRKDGLFEIRRLILEETCVQQIVETGPVFVEVPDTWCAVFSLSKKAPTTDQVIEHKKLNRFIVSAKERLEDFGDSRWDSITQIPQHLWLNKPKMVIGYFATQVAQKLIDKLEQNPPLGDELASYQVSRGEEGSKTQITSSLGSDAYMVIPENVESYFVRSGTGVSSASLTKTKLEQFYKHPKLWIIRIQKLRWKQRLVCALDERTNSAGMKTLQLVVSKSDSLDDLKYLQAILASKLINFWCTNFLADDMNQSYLERIPIPKAIDSERFRAIISLVDRMSELKRSHDEVLMILSDRRAALEREMETVDRKIDAAVYALYGLTPDEIKVVEGANA